MEEWGRRGGGGMRRVRGKEKSCECDEGKLWLKITVTGDVGLGEIDCG